MSSIVQIKDSAYDGLQSLRVYGNTVQNLWVNPSGTSGGVTVTSNADGSMTISGTSTGDFYIYSTIYSLKPGSTYTLSIDKDIRANISIQAYNSDGYISDIASIGSNGHSTNKAVLPQNATYARLMIQGTAGRTLSGTYRVMLNEGSTAQPWCPPGLNSVGDDGSVNIVTAGKNLLKINSDLQTNTINGLTFTPNEDGTITVNGTATANDSDYYIVGTSWVGRADASFPASDLVFSTNGIAKMYGYDSDGAGVISVIVNNGQSQIAASKAQACAKVVVYLSYAAGQGESNKRVYVQLELGSTATAYEPPNITTTPIDLQGHTLNALPDGTRDELHIDGGGNVVLEKRTGTYIANGDEGWKLSATSDVPYRMKVGGWSTDVQNYSIPPGRFQADRLPKYERTPTASSFVVINGRYQLYAARDGIQDASAFSEWLESNPMTVIYPLTEPQTIDLGTVDLPKLRKKPLVNTIWANGTAEGTGFSLAPEIDCEYNQWSTYCDGFKTHGKHSYFDMGCCIAARDTGTPEKKSVTATVPYMSGYYDLSKLYGAIAFEARQLTYRFEFVEDSREELQQKKSQFLEWLSQVHDEEIADDDIPGRHFIGSLSEWEFEEGEEGQSGSLEVTFNCQPFLEADEDTTKTCNAGSNTVTVEGQAVNVYAKTNSGTATIRIGGVMQSVGTTEIRLSVQLQPGDNAVTVTGSPVVLRWKELTV